MSNDGWEKRIDKIYNAYPNVMKVDWRQLFATDPHILGDVINDIIRVTHADKKKGRRGKRANVERSKAESSLERLQDVDYSHDDFRSTLIRLKGDRSIRHFARVINMGTSKTQRLLEGAVAPTQQNMEQIASAFDKDPSFFLEYRIMFITSFVANILELYPESSVVQYGKLVAR